MPHGRIWQPLNPWFSPIDTPREHWSMEALKRNIERLKRPNRWEMRRIYYADGIPHDAQEHYRTKVNSYFKLDSH